MHDRLRQIRRAYFRAPVVSEKQFQGALRLLVFRSPGRGWCSAVAMPMSISALLVRCTQAR
jgi:hypothetical protein